MISLRTASLVAGLIALAMLVAFSGPARVASADTPEQGAGLVVIHKHCDLEGSDGTFDGLIDFEFNPAGLPGPTTDDADSEFDIPFEISCGDGSSNTVDGDTIELDVGTAFGALQTWLTAQGQAVVTSADFEIREIDLPDGVTATYEGCDFDLYAGTITLGLVCVITNTFDEDGDGNGGGGDDPDCPACGCCGFDLDLDIDNDNTNDIDLDNDNTNNNANDNDNANDNENDNENANDNENTNEQNQDNDQHQSNANDQTNNIDSSPEVNISGSLKKPAPAPSASAGGAAITPPSTGDAGLVRGGEATETAGIALMLVMVTGLGVVGLRAASRETGD